MPTWPAQLGTKIFTSHHLLLETRWCEELILFLARHQRWRRRNDGGGAPHILFLTQYHSLSCRMASVEACTQSAQMELIFVRPVLSCPALTHFSWLYHAGIMCWFNKTAGVLFTFLLWISVLGVYICIPWGGTGTYPVLYNIITYWIKQHHAQLDRKPWEEVEVLWAAGDCPPPPRFKTDQTCGHIMARLPNQRSHLLVWLAWMSTAGPFPPSKDHLFSRVWVS